MNTNDTESNTPSLDSSIILSEGTESSFRIVRPAECDAYVKTVANNLREEINALGGANIRVFTDATPASDGVKEILIGNTNRPESAAAYESLKYNDWRICAEEKTVAIAAFKSETLEFAAERFIDKTETEGKTVYYAPFSEEKIRTYDISELTFGGADISCYTIVCENKGEIEFAKSVRNLIAEYSGHYLNIVTAEEDVPSAGKPFYIGSNHYVGKESDKSSTGYVCGRLGEGMSLWYSDAGECFTLSVDLQNGLKNSEKKATLESFLPGAAAVVKEEYMNLKIMSFNVQNGWNTSNIGNRDNLAASKILQYLPDVIGLQEVDPYYREANQPLTSLIASKYTEVNVTGGTSTTDMSWNPIFYNSERLTPKLFGSEVYEDGTFHQSYPHGGKSMFRTISWVIFEDNQSKQNFLFVNTHYDMNSDKSVTESNQRSEAAQLVKLVESIKNTYGIQTVLVSGDYNAASNGIPSSIMKNAGFGDTWDIAQTKDNSNSCGDVGQPVEGKYAWAIDHVFYMAKSITVSEYKTVTDIRDASDHCPIVVSLTVKAS